jgi:hypothetical protein
MAMVLMCGGQVLVMIGSLRLMYITCIAVGLSYGAFNALCPVILSEIFGNQCVSLQAVTPRHSRFKPTLGNSLFTFPISNATNLLLFSCGVWLKSHPSPPLLCLFLFFVFLASSSSNLAAALLQLRSETNDTRQSGGCWRGGTGAMQCNGRGQS